MPGRFSVARTTAVAAASLAMAACDPASTTGALTVAITPPAPTTVDPLAFEVLYPPGIVPSDLTIRWTSDRDAVTTEPSVDPELTVEGEVWSLEVALTSRSGGRTGRASVTVGNSPASGAVGLPSAPGAGEDLVAAAVSTDPDARERADEPQVWSWAWTVDGTDADLDGPVVPAERLSRGQVWTVTATPADEDGPGASATATTTIVDTPPAVTVRLGPTPLRSGDAPVAEAEASDPDGDEVEVALSWQRNGAPLPDGVDDLLTEPLRRGDVLAVTATATTLVGGQPVQTAATATAPVVNAPPMLGGAEVAPQPPTRATPLACLPVHPSDPDGDAVGTTAAWYVNGVPAPGDPLDPAFFARGDLVACALTPGDGQLLGAAVFSVPIPVGNATPTLASAAILPAAPRRGDALLLIPGARFDADGDDIDVHTVWYVDGAEVAEGPVLIDPNLPRGAEVFAISTPGDGETSGPSVVTPTVRVLNALPRLDAAAFDPPLPTTDRDLRVVAAVSDPDGDPTTLRVTFLLDGVVLQDGTDPVLPADRLRAGAVVEAVLTPADDLEAGAPARLGPFVVGNGRPRAAEVRLVPEQPREGSVVTCEADGVSDPEGDPVSLSWSWSVDGLPVQDGGTLDGRAFDKGQVVVCTVTAADPGGPGDAVPSPPTVVANTPPTVAAARLVPDPPVDGAAATAEGIGLADEDPADVPVARVRWAVDGVPQDEPPGPLPDGRFARGQRLTAFVHPFDGQDEGAPATVEAVVANAAPRLTAITITPTDPDSRATLFATSDAWDPDGDPLTPRWIWTVDGTVVQDGPEFRLAPGVYQRGQVVGVEHIVRDTSGTTARLMGPTVTIRNGLPSGRVELVPEPPVAGYDDLRCVIVAADDPDGDVVTWEVRWTVNGQPYPRPGDLGPRSSLWPGDTVPGADLGYLEDWACEATPYDLFTVGPSAFHETTAWAPPLREMTVGDGFVCARTPPGDLRCWGRNDQGQATPPPGRWSQVRAGRDAACAIAPDGRLSCWGDRNVTLSPSGLFQSVDVGDDHACAVRTDGRLTCWGLAAVGRTTPPAGNTWREVDVADFHGCALSADGDLGCWGDDTFGQATVPVPGPWIAVSAGGLSTCAIHADETLTCFGDDGRLPTTDPGPWRAVSVGELGACLAAEGQVLACFGDDGLGGLPAIGASLSVGRQNACALDFTERVTCVGDPSWGATVVPSTGWSAIAAHDGVCLLDGDGRLTCWDAPPSPADLPAVQAVHLGAEAACASTADGPRCWGLPTLEPVPTDVLTTPVVGTAHACGLGAAGAIHCWGEGAAGQLDAPPFPAVQLSAAADHTCAVLSPAVAACWGDLPDPAGLPTEPVARVAAGPTVDCALTGDGGVRCWGADPVLVQGAPLGTGFIDLAVARDTACALSPGGGVTCWGAHTLPGPLVALAGGDGTICGLTPEGDVRCAGLSAR